MTLAVLTAASAVAQSGPAATLRPAPRVSQLVHQPPSLLQKMAQDALEDDPVLAFAAYRALAIHAEQRPELAFAAQLGLGRAWLLVGKPKIAERYALALIAKRPRHSGAWALRVRSLLRASDFDGALQVAELAASQVGLADDQLRSAHASALFRNQQLRGAELGYREVLARDPHHVEALVRLGTGLLPPRPAKVLPGLAKAVELQRLGKVHQARLSLVKLLGAHPHHPMALRLLGELLVAIGRSESPLVKDGFFEDMWKQLATKRLPVGLHRFFPGHGKLHRDRRAMVAWSARPWKKRLTTVLESGGCHHILGECERTTDAKERAWLRGKRTFDGRVWDDVRGIGGLCAATGVEALDDARTGGFQTLVHELAHQVHLYALPRAQRARITALYKSAREHGRCLDYYAASNEAEYFAQGVEAYFSYAKAAGQPVTHGHTHFELLETDPDLYRFIKGLIEFDPLRLPGRQKMLEKCFRAALRVARPEDARTILRMLPETVRQRLEKEAARGENRFRTL